MNNLNLIQNHSSNPQTVKISITKTRDWEGNNSVLFKTVLCSLDELPSYLKSTNFSLNG